jgi:hypothetical protein
MRWMMYSLYASSLLAFTERLLDTGGTLAFTYLLTVLGYAQSLANFNED